MSEYWVSKKKYYCKYCEIYIADDVPSRTQHETGLRHKGNKDRFVRGLYKASERKKKDAEEEKRDMARIDAAANAAFSQDVGAGRAKGTSVSSSAAASASSSKKPPPPKPSNPYADYTTAANLGYEDPDVERAKVEAEKRRTMGVMGDWEVIAPAFTAPLANDKGEGGTWQNGEDKNVKREATAVSDPPMLTVPEDEEDTRTFKLKKRTVGVGLGEIYDPGLIPIKAKKRKVKAEDSVKEEGIEEGGSMKEGESNQEDSLEGTKPKWTKLTWRRPGDPAPAEETKEEQGGSLPSRSESLTIPEGEGTTPLLEEAVKPSIKEEVEDIKPTTPDESPAPPANMFRKRKAPATAAARK